MARMDHTNCTHPRTPAGRATCRKSAVVTPSVAPNASLFKLPTTTLTPAELAAANDKMQRDIEANERRQGIAPRAMDAMVRRTIVANALANTDHCQQCGNTDAYDMNTGNDPDFQGYTRCCNELVIRGGCVAGRCHHLEN